MSLTRKHYEQFAYDIAQQVENVDRNFGVGTPNHDIALAPLRALAQRLCVDFALDNPRFNRQRFLTACGF